MLYPKLTRLFNDLIGQEVPGPIATRICNSIMRQRPDIINIEQLAFLPVKEIYRLPNLGKKCVKYILVIREERILDGKDYPARIKDIYELKAVFMDVFISIGTSRVLAKRIVNFLEVEFNPSYCTDAPGTIPMNDFKPSILLTKTMKEFREMLNIGPKALSAIEKLREKIKEG